MHIIISTSFYNLYNITFKNIYTLQYYIQIYIYMFLPPVRKKIYIVRYLCTHALCHMYTVCNSNPNAGLATICTVWQLWENVPSHSRL